MDRNNRSSRAPGARPIAEHSGNSRHSSRIDRRTFLARGAGIAGAAATGLAATVARAAADAPPAVPKWMQTPGAPFRGYGQPSKYEEKVQRALTPGYGALAPGTGTSRTPLQSLNGTITPNGLHFERHHNGVP